jgi:hypothetical protein
MTYPKHENSAPSEDDLRDLESRNIRDGWPYSDTPGTSSPTPANRPYGSTEGNFDRDHNDGYRIVGVDSTGEEASLKDGLLPETIGRVDSDEIESKIAERFEAAEGAVLENVEIFVDGHTATLTGMVDTPAERRMAARLAISVPLVHHVVNEIESIGVDSHEPQDG